LKPTQVVSEAAGTVALVFVTVAEFQTIRLTGWRPLLAMGLLSELSFVAGYALSGPAPAARVVVALGTANRNIALALLVAVQRFPGTPVVAAVVANGLLLIVLGLLHVGAWRWFASVKSSR
jgi:BASS family bile acid:Na+ symporter